VSAVALSEVVELSKRERSMARLRIFPVAPLERVSTKASRCGTL
jgi:hypothetical protein